MRPRNESPRNVRIVGALLATVWLCAGVLAIVFGVTAQHWLLVIVGLIAVWYGVIWLYVARQGRRLTVREALTPWRLKQRSNADA
jgi:predicted tellurium resistance membrane protein TerC